MLSIKNIKDKQHVYIECTNPLFKFPSLLEWKDTYLKDDDFILALGMSCKGIEYLDLNHYPHTLLGGETGSGKSTLFKLLIDQSLKRGADVYLFDYKEAVDFQGYWNKSCRIIKSIEETNSEFANIIFTMKDRMSLLIEAQVSNIYEYNRMCKVKINRIIVAADEIADLLYKTGKTEEKNNIESIEKKLTTLARLSRANEIHLILSTQRPSADILNGDIKGNIGNRFCGKADSILSKIILDNTDAPNMISENEVGVFSSNSRVLFKSYYMSEQYI